MEANSKLNNLIEHCINSCPEYAQNGINFNEYLSVIGLNSTCEITANLFSKNNLLKYEKKIKKQNLPQAVLRAKRNLILETRNHFVDECLSLKQISGHICFSTLLSYSIDNEKVAIPAIETKTGLCLSTLYSYLYSKRLPSSKNSKCFSKLDDYFNLPSGSFLQTTGHIPNGSVVTELKNAQKSKKSFIQKDVLDTSERLQPFHFPSRLNDELSYIKKFYTSSSFEIDFHGQRRKKTSVWISNSSDGKLQQAINFCERFFGYLHFVLKIPLNELSILLPTTL